MGVWGCISCKALWVEQSAINASTGRDAVKWRTLAIVITLAVSQLMEEVMIISILVKDPLPVNTSNVTVILMNE